MARKKVSAKRLESLMAAAGLSTEQKDQLRAANEGATIPAATEPPRPRGHGAPTAALPSVMTRRG